jgi:peptidyl-prolyl cis-trans isomerase D
MLTWMRRQSGKTWVKAMYVAIAVAFFGGFGLLSSSKVQSCLGTDQQNQKGDVLAEIDQDTTITENDYRMMLNQRVQQRRAWLQQQYPDQRIPESAIDRDRMGLEVMDSMIRRQLLLKEAKKLGIKVSDQEVQDQIARGFADPSTHTFNYNGYRAYLGSRGISEKNFEGTIRDDELANKVLNLVSGSISALPGEVKERYAFEHGEVKLDYLALDPAKLSVEVLPSDTVVGEYYRKHMESYLLSETRRVEYAAWDLAGIKAGATASEQEIKKYYDDSRDRYLTAPEEVRASEIMVRVASDAPQKDIDDAKTAIDKLYADATAPGADFGKLARDRSEGADKDQGGDLGWFTKSEFASAFKVPSMDSDITEHAFALKQGEVSKPFLTQLGWRILKLTGRKSAEYRPLLEVRDEIRDGIIHGKRQALALEQAEAVKAAAAAGKSFTDAARDAGKEVKLSDWFQEDDDRIFGMEDSDAIIKAAFKLTGNAVSDPVAGLDHVYLVRVTEVKPARQGSLPEVKNRIVALLKPDAEREATVQKAGGYLDKLESGELDMEGLAKQLDLKLETTDFMERWQVMLTGVGYSDTLEATVAVLDKDHPWPDQPVKLQNLVVLVHFLDSRPPDMSKWNDDQAGFTRQYLAKKREEIVNDWLKNLRDDRVVFTKRWDEIKPGK